jgi:ABC-type sugar transport system ATPase subunit
MPDPVLELRGIAKRFGGVTALDGVGLAFRPGEVHALVGENGAGKSTLIKIVSGVHPPDAGEVLLDGRPVRFHNPHHAHGLGISVIHQEFNLFPALSVAENVYAGEEHPRTPWGGIDWAEVRRRVQAALDALGVSIDLGRPVQGLSAARMQELMIARALLRDCRVLLLDEPTAALPEEDTHKLFDIVARLKAKGVALVFISHHLDEVFHLADTISVLRDGRLVKTMPAKETNPHDVVALMVGRELEALTAWEARERGAPLLEASGLTRAGACDDVSFTLHRGEILGLAGLVGAGRTETGLVLFGVTPPDAGTIRLEGREVRIPDPARAIELGIAYVSEDRQNLGVILDFPIRENVSLAVLPRLTAAGVLRRGEERRVATEYSARLRVKAPGIGTRVGNLSGGNQQKVLLGKWLAANPRVLILDEPTRGIDVGAKAEIHKLVFQLAKEGLGILLISSDLPEVLSMSDRVLVMREGRIAAGLPRAEATQERVMRIATGVEPFGKSQIPNPKSQ